MNSVWRSLLWKEWREHRRNALGLVAACTVLPLLVSVAFGELDAYFGVAAMMIGLCVPAVAMFVGAAIAAGERSRGTLHFLQALPAPLWKTALAKLMAGGATVLLPAALASIAALSWWSFNKWVIYSGAGYIFDQEWTVLLILAMGGAILGATALSMMIWTAAAGVNHSDELRAGAIGLLTIALVWAALLLTVHQLVEKGGDDWPAWAEIAAAGAPAGISQRVLGRFPGPDPRLNPLLMRWTPYALVFVVSHAALAVWYVRRFGRRAKPQAVTPVVIVTKAAPVWLAPPRRNWFTAIVWKQFRESAPLAALGAVAIFIASLVVARFGSGNSMVEMLEDWQMASIAVWLTAGVFVAVVAGIGLFYDDLRPGLHTFWRSRPIPVDAWFWVKLFSGLCITVGILATGPLASRAIVQLIGDIGWIGEFSATFPAYIGIGLLLHAATFLLAVLAIVLLRQPVLAAIVTIAGGWALAVCVGYLGDRLEASDPVATEDVMVLVGFVGVVVAMFPLVAWKALRRDWGWKG